MSVMGAEAAVVVDVVDDGSGSANSVWSCCCSEREVADVGSDDEEDADADGDADAAAGADSSPSCSSFESPCWCECE